VIYQLSTDRECGKNELQILKKKLWILTKINTKKLGWMDYEGGVNTPAREPH
jgi:hypothetical protein